MPESSQLSELLPAASPAQDPHWTGLRRTRRLLGAVPGPASQARGIRRLCHLPLPALDAEVIDAGFISDAPEGNVAAEKLRRADCDLIVMFAATYLTASMVLPIAQRAGAPVLVIDLQPTAVHGPRKHHHRRLARLLRTVPGPRTRQRVPARRHRVPFRLRIPAPGLGVGTHHPMGECRGRSAAGSARPAMA